MSAKFGGSMKNLTLAYQEPSKLFSFGRNVLITISATLIISLSGIVSIPLFFTPVPIVLQCHVVLLMALFLGSKRGTIATILFLAMGAYGFPVFAGGSGGWASMLGPAGGYLSGYLLGAFVTGLIYENSEDKGPLMAFVAMAAANIVIYMMGMSWLSTYVGLYNAIVMGILPFIAGDLIKMIALTFFFIRVKKRYSLYL